MQKSDLISYKRVIPDNRGRIRTEEQKRNMSLAHLGKHCSPKTEFKKGIIPWNKGKYLPHLSGKNHPNYIDGRTSLRHKIVFIPKYKLWREKVFKRDNYTCQDCNKYGGYLEVHHKTPLIVLLRKYDIKTIEESIKCKRLWYVKNGQTLCRKCHDKTKKGFMNRDDQGRFNKVRK